MSDQAEAKNRGLFPITPQVPQPVRCRRQPILGNLYLKGEFGVPRDPSQAKRLYQSACEQRYPIGCEALSNLP